MTSFSEVLDLAHSASQALNALEEASYGRVLSIFARYENGYMNYGALRVELLKQAGTAYITSGSVASEHVRSLAKASGVSDFSPPRIDSNPVLEKITNDMVRNLEVYRDSLRSEKDLRRLRFRSWLSVQAAGRKGFTSAQLAAGKKLKDQGATLKKVWLANFLDNTPCPSCLALHGSEIDIEEEFDHGGEKAPNVYLTLQGPPRHPNCHCYMLVYVVTLETTSAIPRPAVPGADQFISARDVRRLPRSVYQAITATLMLIAGKLMEVARGKR